MGVCKEGNPAPDDPEVVTTLSGFYRMKDKGSAVAYKNMFLGKTIPEILGEFGSVAAPLAELRELCHKGTPSVDSWTDPNLHPLQGEPVEHIFTAHIALLERSAEEVATMPPTSPKAVSPVPGTPNAGSRATSPKRRYEDDQNMTPSSRRRKVDVASPSEPRTPALQLPPKTGE